MSTQIRGRTSSSGASAKKLADAKCAKAHDSRSLNVGAKAPTPNNALGSGLRVERDGSRP